MKEKKQEGVKMKRIVSIFSALVMLVSLASCGGTTVYNLSDFIPELMDIETQYPYVRRIVVTDLETGENVEFTDGAEHNRIRMQFEQMKCIRTKKTADFTEGYSVRFTTTDGTVEVLIPVVEGEYQATYVYIGQYEYEMLANGVDVMFFESLFEE